MYTPKERCEFLISMLGEQLNEHGHFFNIGKTRLSWRNQDVAMILTTRGTHYSTAECTSRWLRVEIQSHALRRLHKAGAPIYGAMGRRSPQIIFQDDLRTADGQAIEVDLTDWWSIEDAAKQLASQFDACWERLLRYWVDHQLTISTLSVDNVMRVDLSILFGPDAPPADSDELRSLIAQLEPARCSHQFELLGKLLVATDRISDLHRLCAFANLATESGNLRERFEYKSLMRLAEWQAN